MIILHYSKGGIRIKHFCDLTNRKNSAGKAPTNHFPNLTSLPESVLNIIDQNLSNIIVLLNEEGNILYVSKSVENILGFEKGSLAGLNFKEIIPLEELANIIASGKNNLANTSNTSLINIADQSEKMITFEYKVKPIREEKHNLYLVILQNVTSEKETEEMMIRSEKMSVSGQLAAGIAHEIRNPLTSLKGFLQLLQAGVDQKEIYYKIMIDEINKIEAITSELLFISKPLTENKRSESLNYMIQDVIVLLAPQSKLHDINLEWNPQEDINIICDKSQIKQVLINLVKNAIEASNHGNTVNIKTKKSNKKLLIDVIDQGIGISEDVVHKLTEPFFTTKETGTGLGLMITKNLLSYHQAEIEVIQNKTGGSTFRIHFPL